MSLTRERAQQRAEARKRIARDIITTNLQGTLVVGLAGFVLVSTVCPTPLMTILLIQCVCGAALIGLSYWRPYLGDLRQEMWELERDLEEINLREEHSRLQDCVKAYEARDEKARQAADATRRVQEQLTSDRWPD